LLECEFDPSEFYCFEDVWHAVCQSLHDEIIHWWVASQDESSDVAVTAEGVRELLSVDVCRVAAHTFDETFVSTEIPVF